MNTGPLIESALAGMTYSGVVVPIAHLKYSGTAKTYLRYYNYLDQDEYYADDEPQSNGKNDTIDIFSDKRDALYALKTEIKTRLREADFTIGTAGPEMYEDDNQMYHLPINVYHESEV